jgi:hypothetical protein
MFLVEKCQLEKGTRQNACYKPEVRNYQRVLGDVITTDDTILQRGMRDTCWVKCQDEKCRSEVDNLPVGATECQRKTSETRAFT